MSPTAQLPASAPAQAAPVQKPKKKSHPANPFILYYQDMFNKYGGNMYRTARECGRRWKLLPQSEKDKYRRIYIANRARYHLNGGVTNSNRGNRVFPNVARRTVKPSKKQLALQAQQALQAAQAAQAALAQAQAIQAPPVVQVQPPQIPPAGAPAVAAVQAPLPPQAPAVDVLQQPGQNQGGTAPQPSTAKAP